MMWSAHEEDTLDGFKGGSITIPTLVRDHHCLPKLLAYRNTVDFKCKIFQEVESGTLLSKTRHGPEVL
jgi:hypothetical protein